MIKRCMRASGDVRTRSNLQGFHTKLWSDVMIWSDILVLSGLDSSSSFTTDHEYRSDSDLTTVGGSPACFCCFGSSETTEEAFNSVHPKCNVLQTEGLQRRGLGRKGFCVFRSSVKRIIRKLASAECLCWVNTKPLQSWWLNATHNKRHAFTWIQLKSAECELLYLVAWCIFGYKI